MIEFRQKCFTEYDALRTLYTKITRDFNWKNRIKIIEKNALLPVLGGNNIVIERFVISHTFFGKDKYRMYLRLGAKVKLPDGVRLPGRDINDRVAGLSLNLNGAVYGMGGDNNNNQNQKKNKNKNNNNGGGNNQQNQQGQQRNQSVTFDQGGQKEFGEKLISSNIHPNNIDITIEKTIPTGEVVKYEQKERLLVLEFSNIDEAFIALDRLPFGVNYNLFLLV